MAYARNSDVSTPAVRVPRCVCECRKVAGDDSAGEWTSGMRNNQAEQVIISTEAQMISLHVAAESEVAEGAIEVPAILNSVSTLGEATNSFTAAEIYDAKDAIEAPALVNSVSTLGAATKTSSNRTRSESWRDLPHDRRGITLHELWDFYGRKRDWLEELQWRCQKCFRSSGEAVGPCPFCQSEIGHLQMRNLYEVNAEIILPTCRDEARSYVEHLVHFCREKNAVKQVDVFVSHWWGEEFPKLIRALDRYARVRCAARIRWRWMIAAFCIVFVVSPLCIATIVAVLQIQDIVHCTEHFSPAAFLNFILVVAIEAILVKNQGGLLDPMETSFWICAFANNQYAIEHELGTNGDVMSSSFATALLADSCSEVAVVLDTYGMIYKRIWCAFELFVSRMFLPTRYSKYMEVALIDENGVVSDGDAKWSTLQCVREVIEHVSIAEASSTNQEDKANILRFIAEEDVHITDLDEVVHQFSQAALRAASVRQRAPGVIFAWVPLTSISIIFLCRTFLMMCTTGCRTQTCIREYIYLSGACIVVILLLVALPLCLIAGPFLSRLWRWSHINARTVRMITRPCLALIGVVIPSIFLEANYWFNLSSKSSDFAHFVSLSMCIIMWDFLYFFVGLGMTFGVLYYSVRNKKGFQRLRRHVEDALFS